MINFFLNLYENLTQAQRDAAARALWTLAQVVVAVAIVAVTPLTGPFVPVLAMALSALKSYIATKVGDPNEVTFK